MQSSAEPLQGRHALVTGGSRGIGRATAAALASAGAHVTIVARGEEALARCAQTLGVEARAADVADEASVVSLAESLERVPDVVVHAAGAFGLEPLATTSAATFDRMIAVNLRAAFLLMRAFLPGMRERDSGHFVSIGSIAGRVPLPGNGAYAASKFGLRGLHAVLNTELRGTGVRATLVEPAATDTPLWDTIDRAAHPGLPERAAMMQAEAVADAVVYAVTQPAAVAVRNIILERS
ncbi:MAG TPA: SDR family oxidoreductase [Longimicrobiales bacterium]|nr:SDR family oxidoreductase [Longimicrobiales bacterium]